MLTSSSPRSPWPIHTAEHKAPATRDLGHQRPSFLRNSEARLHLPTRRITLEQIVWRLIHEHNVHPRRADWHRILWRHETQLRNTQRHQA